MSTTATAMRRTSKTYPPPDKSKYYDEVPRVAVKKWNPIYKYIARFGPEIAFGELEPAEQLLTLFLIFVAVGLALGIPIYIAVYALR